MKPISILVTGGAGYVGSHVCKCLAHSGYLPITFDNFSRGFRELVQWGPVEEGTLSDGESLERALTLHKPAAVIHCAAYAYVGESMSEPELYWRNNVGETLALLSAMRRHGLGKLIFSSTCATYGSPPCLPIVETTLQQPINPYGATKLAVERMIADFTRAYRLSAVVLRYFNAAGADPDGEIGECHAPEPHLIPLIFEAALGRAPAVEIFGTDYPTSDGTCIRDYIHVSDLAQAHVLALKHLDGPAGLSVFNLGSARPTSVKEMIAVAERVIGRKVPVKISPRRPGDPAELHADSGNAARILGFSPVLSDIETILATAWAWHRRHHGNI